MKEKLINQKSGTIKVCDLAIQHELTFRIGSNAYNSMIHNESGFSLANDIAIAARFMQKNYQ